jgi:LPXTG-motif cell wall-anchored protein
MSSSASEVAPVSSAMSSMTTVAATTSAAVVAPVVTPAAPYEIPNNTTAVHATGTGAMSTRVASPTGMNGTSVEPSTGSASNMAASFGGLVLAAAVAVFAL